MSLVLETLSTTAPLNSLQEAIRQREELGYELVAFGCGMVGGKVANLATFRRRKPGNAPLPVNLVEVNNAADKDKQEEQLNKFEAGAGRVFSFAGLLVESVEANVAAYR